MDQALTWKPIRSHQQCFAKPLTIHRRWPTQQYSAQPLPGKWLLLPITCTSTATCKCPETAVTPEGSAKHPWNAPQNLQHDDNILTSWCWECPCFPRLSFHGSCATRPHYSQIRQWFIWWIQWESHTHHPLAELLKQFWQLQDQFTHLKFATHPPTHTTELNQLTDKLQNLTMMLQLHQSSQPNKEPVTQLCKHTQTPCGHTERIKLHYILTTGYPHVWWNRLLKIRGLAHGPRNHCWHFNWEPHKSSWAKPHGLTHTLIHKAPQPGNAGMNSREYWNWSYVMQIFIPTHHSLWRYKRRIMKLSLPMSTALKQQLSNMSLTMTLWPSAFFVKGLQKAHATTAKIYKKDLKLSPKQLEQLKNWMQHNN